MSAIEMRKRHVATVLCGVSFMLFLVALRPWLPFYANPEEIPPVGNYEISHVTVKVTSHGQPVNHAKITVYRFWAPQETDPANLGSPILLGGLGAEAFTDNDGKLIFATAPGNYTVRAEANNLWAARNVEFKHTYHDVEIDLSTAQQTRGLSLGYTTVIILCVASILMAAGVMSFIQSQKRR